MNSESRFEQIESQSHLKEKDKNHKILGKFERKKRFNCENSKTVDT